MAWNPEEITRAGKSGIGGLVVAVEATDDGCVVSSDKLNVCGVGGSLLEALDDFASSVIEYRDGLEDREADLGPQLRGHLEYLRQIEPANFVRRRLRMLTPDDARYLRKFPAVEQRTARRSCAAIDHCPLLPEFRLLLVAHSGGLVSRGFRTPHKVCRLHEAAMARGAEILDVRDVVRAAEQWMIIAAARIENGWPDDAPVTLQVVVRSA